MLHNLGSKTPLGRVRGLGSAKSGTEHFWLERITAVALIPLIVAFVVLVMAGLGRDHAGAVNMIGDPLVAIVLILAIATTCVHMRVGMQVIIEDYVHADLAKVAALMANTFFTYAVGLASVFAVLKISFGG